MKRVGLVLHAGRAEAAMTGGWLARELATRGIEVVTSAADAARIGESSVVAADPFPDVDLVFVLGGDGTLLRAADALRSTGAPLLGVNFGRLGFLSELERGELADGLRRILDDGFDIEERTVMEAELEGADGVTSAWALNDVIVAKTQIGRAIRVGVAVNDEPVVEWGADGVIVATATGSTAYSFSAGGPIVSPRLACMLVTPVAPHSLLNRSLVVPADEQIVLTVLPDADLAAFSADGGPAVPLSSGAVVRIRASDERVKLAKIDPAPFWALVRDKFRLPVEGR